MTPSSIASLCCSVCSAALALAMPSLAQQAPLRGASVSVSSTYGGYSPEVLTDGEWIAPGQETTEDTGSPDRLGNSGNTWASAAQEGMEQWVRLDFPEAVQVGEVVVWWAQPQWYPKAFRAEYLSDQSWVPLTGANTWYAATERQSTLAFTPVKLRSLRLLQHPNGSGERGLMAAQEILAYAPSGAPAGVRGARELTSAELRAIEPLELERNIARLHERQPGAVEAVAWHADGTRPLPGISDGTIEAAPIGEGARAVGYVWTVQHVIAGALLRFTGDVPAAPSLGFEAGNGDDWFVPAGLSVEAGPDLGTLLVACEPTACDRIRLEALKGLVEVEVYRYIPASPITWPEKLVKDNLLEEEILASGREASYDELCRHALSMRTAHALLGLKDTPHEVGVTWDGTLVSDRPIHFAFGREKEGLDRYPDTVRRVLVDGWLPATVVTGRIGALQVTQTAFISFAGPERTAPALFCRTQVRNVSHDPLSTDLWVTVHSADAAQLSFADGCLSEGDRCLLTTQARCEYLGGAELRIPLELPVGEEQAVDIVQAHDVGEPFAPVAVYGEASFDAALAELRAYWDEVLQPAMVVDVPEEQLNRMVRAVLTQLFITGDGDVLHYGSEPSWYAPHLYGVEEGFGMLALAFCGFGNDAQRYLDGTYLTTEFLRKVDQYKVYADRHQQYRNGLQPHYAVSAYRFTRDDAWIRKHLGLLRDCAEWTMQQRRSTMVLEDGKRPLHWGLLPKWSFGGDISEMQCYALYGNLACWRGLQDTSWLLERLGDGHGARRYGQEAEEYRAVLDEVVEKSYQPAHKPPFLPLSLYAEEPVGNDYYQLFAGLVLDLMPFDPSGRAADYVTDYLEDGNLLFCRMPRFRRDVGAGGLDGLYGLGYLLTKLQQDKLDEFLLGLYGYVAYNMDRDTFASRETNLIYASDLHMRSRYKVPEMSDPVPCSAAVALHYLRNALVTEKLSGPGIPSGELLLLHGTPRAWFSEGKRIALSDAPTHFGEMSLQVECAEGHIKATVQAPTRDPWKAIALRLRPPRGEAFARVTVNGQEWANVDADREVVTLEPGADVYEVVVEYGRG